MTTGLVGSLYEDYPIVQAFQKKETADPLEGIYFYRERTEQYGFQDSKNEFSVPNDNYTLDENQWIIDHIRVVAIVEKVISASNTVSGYDVIAYLGMIFNGTAWLDIMKSASISVLRIQELTSSYFSNDFSLYNQYPALAVQLCYQQTITTTVPWATVNGETIAI